MNELVKQSTELATDIGYTDEVSWTPSPDMDFDQYQRIGRTFQQIKSSLAWWVGDWLNFGEQKFGEAATQAMEDTGKAVETLAKWKAVSWRVPKEIRRTTLTWTHHFYVAYVPDEHKDLLLGLAEILELSSRELKDVVKLDDDTRTDLLIAVGNYMDEEGPMTKEIFFSLLNRFRLGDIDKPKEEAADDEDEESNDSDDEGIDTSEEVAEDDLLDFWENAGVPLNSCGKYAVFWEGISVRAALDGKNRPYLIWEAPHE